MLEIIVTDEDMQNGYVTVPKEYTGGEKDTQLPIVGVPGNVIRLPEKGDDTYENDCTTDT
jgi:hypothetical protein